MARCLVAGWALGGGPMGLQRHRPHDRELSTSRRVVCDEQRSRYGLPMVRVRRRRGEFHAGEGVGQRRCREVGPVGWPRRDVPRPRVFPYKFLLRHYPIRSQAHGERKILHERRQRWDPAERARGWHVQYDHYGDAPSFLWKSDVLLPWDPEEFRCRHLLERLSGVGLPGNPEVAEYPHTLHREVEYLRAEAARLTTEAGELRELRASQSKVVSMLNSRSLPAWVKQAHFARSSMSSAALERWRVGGLVVSRSRCCVGGSAARAVWLI